jgi:hypothetical protein
MIHFLAVIFSDCLDIDNKFISPFRPQMGDVVMYGLEVFA